MSKQKLIEFLIKSNYDPQKVRIGFILRESEAKIKRSKGLKWKYYQV